MNNIRTTRNLVHFVLEKYPDARDSRGKLFQRICQERGLDLMKVINPIDLVKLLEQIDYFCEKDCDRRRREIQNDQHLFPPSPKVQAQRTFFETGVHLK